MIHDLEAIQLRIEAHRYDSYNAKLYQLEGAINRTLEGYGPEPLHLALSGGVDSSLLLAMLIMQGRMVVAHTVGTSETYDDISHVRILSGSFPNVEYRFHIILPCRDDAYLSLYSVLQHETKAIISGDVIDELAGGYYAHQQSEDRETELYEQLSWLRSRHLNPMQAASDKYGMTVFLPYASDAVFDAIAAFRVDELVTVHYRKRPIYDLAVKYGVPQQITERRKIGLVSIEAPQPQPEE